MLIKPLHITATAETPEVILDAELSQFELTGRSLPENAYTFYAPIIDWFNRYLSQERNKTLELKLFLDYYNSSTGRYLMELLLELEEKRNFSDQVTIIWCADQEDELMLEKGQEFKDMLSIPIRVQVVED